LLVLPAFGRSRFAEGGGSSAAAAVGDDVGGESASFVALPSTHTVVTQTHTPHSDDDIVRTTGTSAGDCRLSKNGMLWSKDGGLLQL